MFSGGLVLSISIIDKYIKIDIAKFKILLILSWWLFSASIIFTILSPMTSKFSMTLELKGKSGESDNIDKITRTLNYLSVFSLISAIILCVSFVIKNI